MKKSTKGAIAAGAAAVLLLGGASSLAYWNASASIDGGPITAGNLDITAGTCDANWVYAAGQTGAGTTVTNWVPGDVVTKSCTYTVAASGDNLLATLVTPSSVPLTTTSADGATTESATATVAYKLDGSNLIDADGNATNGLQLDETSDGKVLKATFTVTFPYGDTTTTNANDTQDWVAAFEALTVTLTQLNPNP